MYPFRCMVLLQYTQPNTMRHTLITIFALIVPVVIHAQQDPQYTHNTFDRLSVNPASAGIGGRYCGTMILRQQWLGFSGAPRTGLINLQAPVSSLRGGLGLTFIKDALGQESNTTLRLAYAHHIALPNGSMLGIGAAGGIYNKKLGNNWFALQPQDVVLNTGVVSHTLFNLSSGLYYSQPGRMYVGLSATNLTKGQFQNLNIDSERHYYLMAGYSIQLPAGVELRPSLLAKTDAASTQIDLNCLAVFNGAIYGGLTYRHGDALAPMVGYMGGNWRAGYSYDITTSDIALYSSGSHEIMFSYCFKPKPKYTKYRDVRNMGTSPWQLQ